MLFVINKILYKKVLKIKKIKVIQVISDSNIGGAGKVVLNLLSCFDKNEIDCEIIIPKNSQLKSYIKDMGYKIFEISSFGEVSFDFDLTKKLVKVFKREKPDIVHTHASLSARIAAKILKIKVVYTRHWLGLKKTNFLLKLINNYFCDAAIAVSQEASHALIATGINAKKVNIVRNGIMPLRIYSEMEKKFLRHRYGIENEFIFGVVARLEKVKGIRYFIEAANKFLSCNKNVKFLIFGDGNLKNNLENYVHELCLDKKIIFCGFIKNVEEAMNLFDVFVLPSIQEALPLALLEAMSLGCACIATECGGPSEIIVNKKNGILVKKKSVDDLFKGMKLLFDNNDLRKKIGNEALKLIKNNFSAQEMTSKTIKIYERLVGI